MAKILFWSGDTTSACTFYRCAEPGRVLRRLGHETRCDNRIGLAAAALSDVVVIQRPTEVTITPILTQLLAQPESKRPRIVVELDDDLFAVPEHNPAHAMMADPARRHRLAGVIQQADVVTVTNTHLGAGVAMVREEGAHVRVVPNYVPERFVVEKVPELSLFGTPTITWAGSDTHRRDFDLVAVALRKLLRERNDFRVRIVGAPYADRLYSAATVNDLFYRSPIDRVQQVPWIEGVDRYIPTLAGHIGLAPLADDLFNRSKSDLRLRELAARGMAVVADAVGPYGDSPVPRATTVPSFEDGDWYGILTAMIDQWDQTYGLAERSLDWAQANTLEAHAAEWAKALLD
jgi:glycosyltransferase involved in cell wall biosynthesis